MLNNDPEMSNFENETNGPLDHCFEKHIFIPKNI